MCRGWDCSSTSRSRRVDSLIPGRCPCTTPRPRENIASTCSIGSVVVFGNFLAIDSFVTSRCSISYRGCWPSFFIDEVCQDIKLVIATRSGEKDTCRVVVGWTKLLPFTKQRRSARIDLLFRERQSWMLRMGSSLGHITLNRPSRA